jgi:hypothetical protein
MKSETRSLVPSTSSADAVCTPSPWFTAGESLAKALDSVSRYLEAREHRKALEAQFRMEEKKMKAVLNALRMKVEQNIKYWKQQVADRDDQRNKAVDAAIHQIKLANQAVKYAFQLARGGAAATIVDALATCATEAIRAATAAIADGFPKGPLASIE